MNWYYESNGQPIGPIPDAEFAQLATAGTIAPDTLVWREGMAKWQAHASVLPAAAAGQPRFAVAPVATVVCPDCGGTFPACEVVSIAGVSVCAGCKPARLQRLQEGQVTMPCGLWRSGKTLVMSREAQVPARCVHCNTTANLRRVQRRLYWHHPAIYVTLIAGLLVYVILALVVRKTATFEVSICQADVVRRRGKVALAWFLLLAMPVSLGVLGAYKVENALWLLPVVLFIAAVVASRLSRPVYARKIDEKAVWVGGVCPEFLKDLPEWTGK